MPSNIETALPNLVAALRRAGFEVGVEQYLAACDLVVSLAAHGPMPGAEELRATLAGVFCTSPREQAKFPEVFHGWYRHWQGEAEPPPPPVLTAEPPNWTFFDTADTWRAWLWVGLVCVLLAGGGYWLSLNKTSVQPEPVNPGAGAPGEKNPPPSVSPQSQRITPRQPPEPVIAPPVYLPGWVAPVRVAWMSVALLWVVWMLWRLALRYLVLARRRACQVICVTDCELHSCWHSIS